jgi:hypothetical protein
MNTWHEDLSMLYRVTGVRTSSTQRGYTGRGEAVGLLSSGQLAVRDYNHGAARTCAGDSPS